MKIPRKQIEQFFDDMASEICELLRSKNKTPHVLKLLNVLR